MLAKPPEAVKRVAGPHRREYHAQHMFIVKWDGPPPEDKPEWIEILRDALASELGSYRVVFQPGEARAGASRSSGGRTTSFATTA